MTFGWPLALISLLVLPALVIGYRWLIRRRRRRAVPYSSIAVIRTASPRRTAWRRHAPFALVLAALACLGLAGARPEVKTAVPVSGTAVILALDVSGSMCATDVDPNRLTAAETAVRDFVKRQSSATRIGLVVFSGFAELAVPPTTDRKPLVEAINTLTTGRGTAIGAAILKSVDAVAQIDPDVAPADADVSGASGDTALPAPAPGTYAPEIVVLLTDGRNTTGTTPLEAAKVAAARGVRVYPIGFGTTNPTTLVCTADQLGGTGFNNFRMGGFGGGLARRGFLVADEATLRQVATTTGGTYFQASRADQLQGVLAGLPHHVDIQHRTIEVSVWLAGLAALLIMGAVWAASRWSTFPS